MAPIYQDDAVLVVGPVMAAAPGGMEVALAGHHRAFCENDMEGQGTERVGVDVALHSDGVGTDAGVALGRVEDGEEGGQCETLL